MEIAIVSPFCKIRKIEEQIKLLSNLPGYECFHTELYPPLLEYFDSKCDYTYLSSKKCLPEKKDYKHYEKVIAILWNMPP